MIGACGVGLPDPVTIVRVEALQGETHTRGEGAAALEVLHAHRERTGGFYTVPSRPCRLDFFEASGERVAQVFFGGTTYTLRSGRRTAHYSITTEGVAALTEASGLPPGTCGR